jgi:hypothetical protein
MYLVKFSIDEIIHGIVLNKKRQEKTIKKIVINRLWKELNLYGDHKQAMSSITILCREPLKCKKCGDPVSVHVYAKNGDMLCQDCFDLSLLPRFYKQLGYKPNNHIIDDGDVIFIISQN